MSRPHTFCHMITSIDGKIDGRHKEYEERGLNALDFYNIAFSRDGYYQIDGQLSGRATSEAGFTKGRIPKVNEEAEQVPAGDFIADQSKEKYYVSVDPSGKLGWENNTVQYRDTEAHIIEVLTEKASNAYRAYLRELNISYLIVGQDMLDNKLLLEKLKELFKIDTLMIGGGVF